MNKLFYEDYLRYQQDRNQVELLYKDIRKYSTDHEEVKVVFKGFPKYYNVPQVLQIGDYFMHDRLYDEFYEKTSTRIIDFMRMLGMRVVQPNIDEIESVWPETIDMDAWPKEFSIKRVNE